MGLNLDINKLSKVLAMTTSTSDGEALVAARKAVAMVSDAGLSYDTLFSEYLPNHYEGTANAGWIDSNKHSWLARALIKKLQNEITELRRHAKTPPAASSNDPELLRKRLLSAAPLNSWERSTLGQISTIEPKSKEAYYILWLARRHKLTA
jgi:hypothetical protein